MKVKIGDVVYDAHDLPIMVILTPGEKQQIANMAPDATKYCQYPETYSPDEIRTWMRNVK